MECITGNERIHEIVKKYFDTKVEITFHETSSETLEVIKHPFLRKSDFLPNADQKGNDSTVEKIIKDEERFQEVKEKIWNEICELSLDKIVCRLDGRYISSFLKEIRSCISDDDFSVALCNAWCNMNGLDTCINDDFTKQDILNFLSSCNPKKFMNPDEYAAYEALRMAGTQIYRADYSGLDTSNTFSWSLEPTTVLAYAFDIAGIEARECSGYSAFVEGEDIFAVIDGPNGRGIIVNPDKVHHIEYMHSLGDLCDDDELARLTYND